MPCGRRVFDDGGHRAFCGKGARGRRGGFNQAVLAGREDTALRVRGEFRGFEILSRGRVRGAVLLSENDSLPELLIRGSGTFARSSMRESGGNDPECRARTPCARQEPDR